MKKSGESTSVTKPSTESDQAHLLLHMVEDGHGRESTSFYELLVDSGKGMSGEFTSMVADQTGTTTWQREPF